jgi:hypothetical protein
MGRNRPKANAIGAVRYDIFGNVLPETPAAPAKASPEEIAQWRRIYNQSFDRYTKASESAREMMRSVDGKLIRWGNMNPYDPTQSRELDEIMSALTSGADVTTIPNPQSVDPTDGTWDRAAYEQLLRRAQATVRPPFITLVADGESYERAMGITPETPAVPEVPAPTPAPQAAAPKAVQDVNGFIDDVLGSIDGTPRLTMRNTNFDDVPKAQRDEIRQRVNEALDDIAVKVAQRIVEQDGAAPRYGTVYQKSMSNILRNVDELNRVMSHLARVDMGEGQSTRPGKAEAERVLMPRMRDTFSSIVLSEVRRAVRQANNPPSWAGRSSDIQRVVEDTVAFAPINARNRARS